MSLTTRLLGLAFASADALVELDEQGRIAFAIGAGAESGQDAAAWQGRPLQDLLHQGAAAVRATRSMTAGGRAPATPIIMKCGEDRGRRASLRAFVLPQLAPAVSCALTYEGPAFALADLETPPLVSAEEFLDTAAQTVGRAGPAGVALAFVDVHGLDTLPAAVAARVGRRIEATLQSGAAAESSAAQITDDRFALLRPGDDRRDLAAEIVEAARMEGATVAAQAFDAEIPRGADPLCVLRAMRYAIDGCLKGDGLANPQIAFSDSLKRTFRDAEAFRTVVKAREFQVHYQPIVHLDSRAVHHFEALARFNANSGPAQAIRMAEELALIESFDLAVAEKVLKRMRQPGAGLLKMAVNASGASLGDNTYVENLLRMTAGAPDERRRLIVEVTETAALSDLEAANRRLTALRDAGIKVCIDDFGAGSTSYDYLRRLSVDAVKIDGALIRDIDADERAQALTASIVDLCRSLRLEVIAEMIESEPVAERLRKLGVQYGQGWLFGRAEAEPRTQLSTAPIRRRGAVEAWG